MELPCPDTNPVSVVITGFSGTNCQVNVNECRSDPCRNGATCHDRLNNFYCTCRAGFTGRLCQSNINDCARVICRNGGVCVDLINSYRCDCVAGFDGRHCTINMNECQSGPCLNGARCEDGVNIYSCHCLPGKKLENYEFSQTKERPTKQLYNYFVKFSPRLSDYWLYKIPILQQLCYV